MTKLAKLDALTVAAVAFMAANLLHTADHQRQGTERLTTEIYAGGTAITLMAIGTLVLVLRRHPRAPLIAAVVGLWSGLGVTASHIAPHWSAFSDSYGSGQDALSWIIVAGEIGTAFVLGLNGMLALRRSRSGHAPATAAG